MKKIALIGSTGSIGVQTLNVVRRHPDKFKIVSLTCGSNDKLLQEQIKEFKPSIACSINPVQEKIDGVKYFDGDNSFTNAITSDCDVVVVALVGFKGIIAVLDAIEKGKDIALANKESLVVGGDLVMQQAREKGVKIYPIDSEHSAVWQSLSFDYNRPLNKIILTCSGGAFRDKSKEELKNLTAKEALKHPNWNMGAKITVDCATLVNKGFEVIEAHYLYNIPYEKIDVIIHKESIIHSMVEYVDGSTIAQMSYPSMEIPITLALTAPERINTDVKGLDFAEIGKLTFASPDSERFPCLELVINAGKIGRGYPAVVNGANEQAVKLFLQGKIKYDDIYACIKGAFDAFKGMDITCFDDLLKADAFGVKYVIDRFGV